VKLSFILPVFNAGQYLRDCLDSLLAQNLPADEYEIVAVNDGSTDNSLAVLREYEAANPGCFVICDQANAGPGVARNAGFAASRGDYVWFADADDIVRRDCLAAIAGTLAETGAELFRVGYLSFEGEKGELPADAVIPAAVFDAIPTTPAKELCFSNWTPWDKIFARGLLVRAGLEFPPLMLGDDAAELFRVTVQARKIIRSETVCYFYRQRPGSLMRVLSERNITDNMRSAEIVASQISTVPELREEYGYFHWKLLDYMLECYEGAAADPKTGAETAALLEACLPKIREAHTAATKTSNQFIGQHVSQQRILRQALERFEVRVKNSLSWQITAPLRFIAEILLKLTK